MDSELEKLNLACKEWGFFQLINHSVSPFGILQSQHGREEKILAISREVEGFRQALLCLRNKSLIEVTFSL
ncbi:Protein SRG1 [Melia azedarach]|uniref:Protein SRG1 n=1 Tax=Melia azedarach TaxID=155640 RepID=A0ACC1YSM3_MELAZ|nr:Protein SRG1 [Melia azedarach]